MVESQKLGESPRKRECSVPRSYHHWSQEFRDSRTAITGTEEVGRPMRIESLSHCLLS
jgi:hypothetical protein